MELTLHAAVIELVLEHQQAGRLGAVDEALEQACDRRGAVRGASFRTSARETDRKGRQSDAPWTISMVPPVPRCQSSESYETRGQRRRRAAQRFAPGRDREVLREEDSSGSR